MLDLKRFSVRVIKEDADGEISHYSSYFQRFYDATDSMHAKHLARLDFGSGFQAVDVWGPFDNLPVLG